MELIKNYGDKELLQAIRDDKDMDNAVKYLYRHYFNGISIYVQQNQGNRQDAEDIFQESVVALIQMIQQNRFRGDAGVKTFLFAIGRNTWLNELKRKGRAVTREAKFEGAKETIDEGISRYIGEREARKQVLHIMDKLGKACKKILLAFYYENLSMKEILVTMNYDNDQVLRNKKHKCLKQLEQMLTADPVMAKNLKAALQYEQ